MPLTSTYLDNTPTPAPSATVGFKISKPGYDASRTAGSNYVFDSSWPSLAVAYESSLANPVSGGGTYTVNHGLNFPPLTFAWFYGPDISGIGNTVQRYILSMDGNNAYIDTSTLDAFQQSFVSSATWMNVKCFQLDLSKDIDYTLAPGDTFKMPYDPNFGVKIVKPNKSVDSRDLRDFTIHSRAQTPLVLAVKTQATSTNGANNVVQYTSKLSYASWVYGFVKTAAGRYRVAPYYTQSYPKTFTDGFLSYVQYQGTDIGATLVILRDPMFASTQATAQY